MFFVTMFIIGWCIGLFTAPVIKSIREKRSMHPMQFKMKFPMNQVIDLQVHEPPFIPTPKQYGPPLEETVTDIKPVLQACDQCGKEYKNVKQHVRLSHKEINV